MVAISAAIASGSITGSCLIVSRVGLNLAAPRRSPVATRRLQTFNSRCPLVFYLVPGQPGSGEASFDEAGPVLDLPQAVPDDLDQVAEAGDGEVGQHAAFKH